MMRALFVLSGAFALVACGDPVVTEHYAGTPVFEIGGAVVQANARIPASHGVSSARLFWIGAAPGDGEQAATLGSGLAEFSITLFDPPPSSAAAFSDLVSAGTLGIGVIALYADTDDDQTFDPTQDRLLGASAQHVVVHASEGVASGDPAEAVFGLLSPGYHLFVHDQPSQCRFVDAATCPPEGSVSPAPNRGDVTLTLWSQPEEVRVPAPALEPDTSIRAQP